MPVYVHVLAAQYLPVRYTRLSPFINILQNCDAGQYSGAVSGMCTPCAAGQYSEATGQPDSCISCSALGASRYQSETGQVSCDACAEGMKPTIVLDACTCVAPCPKGKYGAIPSCIDCPAGKFFVAVGARELANCGDCPLGTWSSTLGASSLTQCVGCPAGKRGKASGQATAEGGCADCTIGESYQDQTGQASCIPAVCPKGQYASSSSSAGVTQAPLCTMCPAGAYGSVRGLTKAGDCSACSAGKYGSTTGATLPSNCIACGPGQYEDQEGRTSCKLCAAGSASGTGAVRCGACYAGKRLKQTGTNGGGGECVSCPAGRYSEPASGVCHACEAGKSSRSSDPICTACEPGTYQAGGVTDVLDETSIRCQDCDAGQYSAAQASECTKCAAGQYLASAKGTACKLCTAGRFLDEAGQTHASDCTNCAVGRFNPTQGSSEARACQLCSLGRHGSKSGATGPESCAMCAAGRVGAEPGLASSSCSRKCGAGNFSKQGDSECRVCGISEHSAGGAEACALCGPGETTLTRGATACVCQIGYLDVTRRDVGGKQADKGRGEANSATTTARVTCEKCPTGFVCDNEGVVLATAKVKPGFWRADDTALRVMPCPNKLGCNGSTSAASGSGGCALGHEGPFCSLCSSNFTRFSEESLCTPCPSEDSFASSVAGLVGVIIGGIVGVVGYALFNHKVPKGVLKPFINGMQVSGHTEQ